MTNTEIETLFFEAIQEKAIYNKLEGVSRNTVFNWLNQRSKPTVGDMLNVLHQLKKIEVTPIIKKVYNVSIFVDGRELKSATNITENNGLIKE